MTWLSFETLPPWLASAGRVVLILGGAYLVAIILRRFVATARASALGVMMRHAGGSAAELEKRANTIIGIGHKAVVSLLWGMAIVMALEQLGFDITPIIAGAGVAGLAVGFGAQNLVRDVISGFFILIENQIRVNDVAIINGTGGLVEEINLRTTVLRSADGVVHVFPNGAITSLSNMTREFSFYVLEIGVAYKEDTDRVVQVLVEVAEGLRADPAFRDFVLEPLDVQGVDRFTDSSVVVRARIKTQPVRQWVVGRELNRRIKKRFDELGIEIPFPHRTLQLGRAGEPLLVQVTGTDAPQIRHIVREVVEELGLLPQPGAADRSSTETTPGT